MAAQPLIAEIGPRLEAVFLSYPVSMNAGSCWGGVMVREGHTLGCDALVNRRRVINLCVAAAG